MFVITIIKEKFWSCFEVKLFSLMGFEPTTSRLSGSCKQPALSLVLGPFGPIWRVITQLANARCALTVEEVCITSYAPHLRCITYNIYLCRVLVLER